MIAIIPARKGSKGLPGKNIKLLNAKPLIAYSIEAALKAKYIDRIIVSTDSKEIADLAKAYGAEVPFKRPNFLSKDNSKAIDVFKYTLEKLEKIENNYYNEFIILQPTSPLRTTKHIDEAIELFYKKNAKSVISFCEEDHPIFWHKFITNEGKFEEIFSNDYLKNRQEIRKTYRPNGAIYIFKKEILNTGNYYTENSYAYIMDRKSSVDIDNLNDFKYAEFLLS